jgi:copper homeostasis protein
VYVNPSKTDRAKIDRSIVFELCAETVEACMAAQDGAADRIELCSALSEDGLTPSYGLVRVALDRCNVPIHVLLRPRGGDFFYSDAEYSVIREDLLHLRDTGVSGFVLGFLHADKTVDKERTRALVELASPLQVTFHRAFDSTPSLEQALEDVIATGCHRVLTSGGEADVVAGAPMLTKLVKQAAGRIHIAAGGGLRLEDAAWLAHTTQVKHFHGSLRYTEQRPVFAGVDADAEESTRIRSTVQGKDIRNLIEALRHG